MANNGNEVRWYSDASLTNYLGSGNAYQPLNALGTSNYYVTQVENDCESDAVDFTIVIDYCDTLSTIIIPTAFTPDGDQVNDYWNLKFIDLLYPGSQVVVFNRWGSIVYESIAGSYSDQVFDGTLKGEPLPVGSYYYLLSTNNSTDEVLKGTITLIRE
jgi:gliding motility-associated-like protein